ncbi:hypothetical protein RRG08_010379 [Elysia crispata]|uniref:Uncharacterized protein n=1 Tax=Elysia crispata TaxID=231223 RepID=A0AAE1BAP4_9GAST|nr:hypothetical protein RRG08_010379 [Elysia crispata]
MFTQPLICLSRINSGPTLFTASTNQSFRLIYRWKRRSYLRLMTLGSELSFYCRFPFRVPDHALRLRRDGNIGSRPTSPR